MRDQWIPFTLDTRVFREQAPGNPPLFSRTPYGVRVRTGDFAYTAPHHVEQLLQVLAEIDLAAQDQLVLQDGETARVGELVSDALRRFTEAQELEFTTTAFTMWLPPRRSWTTRFGQRITFDVVAQQLLSRPLGEGACAGTHVPFALVHLLRAHEMEPILSDATYGRIRSRLAHISGVLEQTHLPAGTWDEHWHDDSRPPAKSAKLGNILVVTGHHLEWIAFAPMELRPERRTTERAAESLVEVILKECPPSFIANSYPPISHAARALFLLSLSNESPTQHPAITSQQSNL